MERVRFRSAWILLALLSILALSVGCTRFGVVEHAGLQRSTEVDFDYRDSDSPTRVTLKFGAAELRADARGEKLLEGTIEYNVTDLTPDLTSGKTWVEISQDVERVGFIGVRDLRNEWDLHFGNEQPIYLEINAGAYDGTWDLGGVPIREMVVNQGASRSTFDFSAPNPETMSELVFRTGAADLELRNLANAGFREMRFEGGVSSYTLDFGGRLMRDGFVAIKAGVSNIRLVIPADTPAQVVVRGFTNVDADRGFLREGSAYLTPAWDTEDGARLEIEIDAGLANVELDLDGRGGSSL